MDNDIRNRFKAYNKAYQEPIKKSKPDISKPIDNDSIFEPSPPKPAIRPKPLQSYKLQKSKGRLNKKLWLALIFFILLVLVGLILTQKTSSSIVNKEVLNKAISNIKNKL